MLTSWRWHGSTVTSWPHSKPNLIIWTNRLTRCCGRSVDPASRGQLIVAGAGGDEPISVAPVPLLFGMRSLAGTMTGSSIDAEDTLSFSSLQQIRPMIETVPLANAAEAYGRMMRNEARFRIVLVTGQY